MVAFNFFDEHNNLSVKPNEQLLKQIQLYTTIKEQGDNKIDAALTEFKTNAGKSNVTTKKQQASDISASESNVTDIVSNQNKLLRDQLKVIQRAGLHGENMIVQKDDGTLDSEQSAGGLNGAQQYTANLAASRIKQKHILDSMNATDGEKNDSILQRKSYRFHSAIFNIIFLIVVGLIIRVYITPSSSSIETVILVLGVCILLYYLVDYFF